MFFGFLSFMLVCTPCIPSLYFFLSITVIIYFAFNRNLEPIFLQLRSFISSFLISFAYYFTIDAVNLFELFPISVLTVFSEVFYCYLILLILLSDIAVSRLKLFDFAWKLDSTSTFLICTIIIYLFIAVVNFRIEYVFRCFVHRFHPSIDILIHIMPSSWLQMFGMLKL